MRNEDDVGGTYTKIGAIHLKVPIQAVVVAVVSRLAG